MDNACCDLYSMEKDIHPKGQMSETSAVVETYSSNVSIHTTLKHSDWVSMVDNYDSDYEVICDLDDKMSIESSKKGKLMVMFLIIIKMMC